MRINNFSEFNIHFQIFGSENSQDCDVIVFVKSIPNDVSLASSMCKEYDKKISEIINDKMINSNLGIFTNGNIVDVFKRPFCQICASRHHRREDKLDQLLK